MNLGNQSSSLRNGRYGGLLLSALLLMVVVSAVFGRVYNHDFLLLWDDQNHVKENPRFDPVTWQGVGEFWTEPYWGLYVPLSYTFFAGEAVIARRATPDALGWTLDPAVFHLGNLLLHVVCVWLVFVILRRLFRHDGAACAGALLFGLHPVQVESVAWISETRGVLCGVFSLLAVWQYLCYTGTSRRGTHYVLATAAFLLALLAKPAAVAVPLIVVVLEMGLLRGSLRRILLGLGPWLAVAVGWTMETRLLQPDVWIARVPPAWWARPLLAGDALLFYLYQLVAPIQCAADYGRSPAWVMERWWWFYLSWLLPVILLAALACLKNRRVWLTASALFMVWLLPVLGLVPFSFQRISTVADRYLYLAMLGPALALSWFLARRWDRVTVGISTAVLCLLGLLSFNQTSHWRNDQTLIQHMLRVNPDSVVANHNRGLLRARLGLFGEAEFLYQKVLRVDPLHADTHRNLGLLYREAKNEEASKTHLRKALELLPPESDMAREIEEILAQYERERNERKEPDEDR